MDMGMEKKNYHGIKECSDKNNLKRIAINN